MSRVSWYIDDIVWKLVQYGTFKSILSAENSKDLASPPSWKLNQSTCWLPDAAALCPSPQVHSKYRRTGASFTKAQQEFSQGVLTNRTVQTVAADAATSAAQGAIGRSRGNWAVSLDPSHLRLASSLFNNVSQTKHLVAACSCSLQKAGVLLGNREDLKTKYESIHLFLPKKSCYLIRIYL